MTPALGLAGRPYPFESIHEDIAREASELGVVHVDLLEAVRDWDRARLWAHPTDPHPSVELHALAGERLAEALLPLLGGTIGTSTHSLAPGDGGKTLAPEQKVQGSPRDGFRP